MILPFYYFVIPICFAEGIFSRNSVFFINEFSYPIAFQYWASLYAF